MDGIRYINPVIEGRMIIGPLYGMHARGTSPLPGFFPRRGYRLALSESTTREELGCAVRNSDVSAEQTQRKPVD